MALGKSKEVELTTLVEMLGDTNGEDSRSTDRFLVFSSKLVCVQLLEDSTPRVCVPNSPVSGIVNVLVVASICTMDAVCVERGNPKGMANMSPVWVPRFN